jgi:hypothetical protein
VITVACLMPTIPQHAGFLEKATKSFYAQIYPKTWDVLLHVDGDPQPSLGTKINCMVKTCLDVTAVDFFVLMDSDDHHHPTRVQRQVEPMIDNQKLLMTGTSVLVYRNTNGEVWQYAGRNSSWIGGLAFSVRAWKRYQFENISPGVDTSWQKKFAPDTRLDLRDESLMLCSIHSANTCRKTTAGREWMQLPCVPQSLRDCM